MVNIALETITRCNYLSSLPLLNNIVTNIVTLKRETPVSLRIRLL